MSTYICRLMASDGTVRSVVPIIGSNETDAVLIARHHLKSSGDAGTFELWQGKTRILAQGLGATEGEEKVKVPQISRITHAGC